MTYDPNKEPKEETISTDLEAINQDSETTPKDFTVTKIEQSEKDKRSAAALSWELSTTKKIEKSLAEKDTGAEPYIAPVIKMSEKTNSSNFFSKARSFTLGLLTLGSVAAKAEIKANTGDSLEKKPVATSTFEDSTKSNKPGTIEMKKVGITWIEATENVGGLELEGKAIVPFSDTSKIVSVLKFTSGSAEEMIAAAQKAGYKILSPQDFKKMYTENQNQSKKLAQTFCGEKSTDVDDTKAELYQKVTDNSVETNLKQTHAVYPYIGLNGSLTRYEESESLNYEAGLAVYKENK